MTLVGLLAEADIDPMMENIDAGFGEDEMAVEET